MTTSIIDSLVSDSIFNFRLFRYGVAYDRVTCSWLERFIGGARRGTGFGFIELESIRLTMGSLPMYFLSTLLEVNSPSFPLIVEALFIPINAR